MIGPRNSNETEFVADVEVECFTECDFDLEITSPYNARYTREEFLKMIDWSVPKHHKTNHH